MFDKAFPLPASIYSANQLDGILRELDTYIGFLRRTAILQRSGLAVNPKDQPVISPGLADVMAAANITDHTVAVLSQLKLALNHLLVDLVEVRITCSALPDRAVLEKIVEWFRRSINPQLLFDFEQDGEMLGGIIVRTPHAEYDWSFRSLLIAHSNDVMGIVHNVG